MSEATAEEVTLNKDGSQRKKPGPAPGSSGAHGGKSNRKNAPKAKLETELWEADLALKGASLACEQRTGVQINPPDEKGKEHLAHLIRRIMAKPGLSRLQAILATTYDSGRPGKSVMGDLVGFLTSLYAQNQILAVGMAQQYMASRQPEPEPANGGIPPKDVVERSVGNELTDEQYLEILVHNGYISPEYAEEMTNGE